MLREELNSLMEAEVRSNPPFNDTTSCKSHQKLGTCHVLNTDGGEC